MKITGFENIISIEQFEYCCKVNEHESCLFSCYVKEKDIESFLGLCDSDCCFEADSFKFEGHVTEISMSKDISGVCMTVTTVGQTYQYDKEKHSRIFQSNEKTISDILSYMDSMSDIKHEIKQEETINEIVVQDNETNWQFAKKIIQRFGEYIFTGENVFIGKYGTTIITLEEDNFIDYEYNIHIGGVKLYCKMYKNMNLGDVVKFNNKDFFVREKKYVLEHQQYYFIYLLSEIDKEENDFIDDTNVSLVATVTDNNDPDKRGRVKVSFESEEMEDCMQDKSIWLDRNGFYSTKGYGAIFIPAIEDKVRINIFRGKGIVIGGIRDEAYDSIYQDCNVKYLVFGDKSYVEYKEGELSFYNNNNTVRLSGEGVVVELGENAKITINEDKACVQIDKAIIEMTSDIKVTGGKCIIEAKNEASISANCINIKGKSGVSIN